jgi:hypothetical protein
MHSAPSNYPKLVVNWQKIKAWGVPCQKLNLKNGTVETFFDVEDAVSRFKFPIISCSFDKNLSPKVGGTPS